MGTNRIQSTSSMHPQRDKELTSDATSTISLPHLQAAPTSIYVRGDPFLDPIRSELFVTIYTIRIACPMTNVLWVVRQRYSHFFATRKNIMNILWEKKNILPNKTKNFITTILHPLREFPKRRLLLDDNFIIAERVRGLSHYVSELFHVRENCLLHLSSMRVPNDTKLILKTIVERIEEAIEMPSIQKTAEGIWRDRSAKVDCQVRFAARDMTCPICLEKLDPAAPSFTNVILLCSHAFHHDCVSTWLSAHSTCPLCRVQA